MQLFNSENQSISCNAGRASVHKDVCLWLFTIAQTNKQKYLETTKYIKSVSLNYSTSTWGLTCSHATFCLGENNEILFLAFRTGKDFLKRLIMPIVGESVENLTFLCTSGGNTNWWNLFEQPLGSINLKNIHALWPCLELIPQEHNHKSTGPADGGTVYTSRTWKPPKYPSIEDELNNSCSTAQWIPYFSTWISNRHLKQSIPKNNSNFPNPTNLLRPLPPQSGNGPRHSPSSRPNAALTPETSLPLVHIPSAGVPDASTTPTQASFSSLPNPPMAF